MPGGQLGTEWLDWMVSMGLAFGAAAAARPKHNIEFQFPIGFPIGFWIGLAECQCYDWTAQRQQRLIVWTEATLISGLPNRETVYGYTAGI